MHYKARVTIDGPGSYSWADIAIPHCADFLTRVCGLHCDHIAKGQGLDWDPGETDSTAGLGGLPSGFKKSETLEGLKHMLGEVNGSLSTNFSGLWTRP